MVWIVDWNCFLWPKARFWTCLDMTYRIGLSNPAVECKFGILGEKCWSPAIGTQQADPTSQIECIPSQWVLQFRDFSLFGKKFNPKGNISCVDSHRGWNWWKCVSNVDWDRFPCAEASIREQKFKPALCQSIGLCNPQQSSAKFACWRNCEATPHTLHWEVSMFTQISVAVENFRVKCQCFNTARGGI